MRIGDLQYGLLVHPAAQDQRHIGKAVESTVAGIEQVRRDLTDGFGRAADVAADAVLFIHPLQHPVKATVAGAVVVHPDLLGDDAKFGFYRFLRKMGVGHKVEQLPERFFKAFGTAEKIGGLVERGVGVCIGAVLRKPLKGIGSVLVQKQLVLQKMSDSVRHGDTFSVADTKAVVDRAVAGAKQGVSGGHILGKEIDIQSARMPDLLVAFAQKPAGKGFGRIRNRFCHTSSSSAPPFRLPSM